MPDDEPVRCARCGLCGGPHEYDTAIPDQAWKSVVRSRGLPDQLCLSCIVAIFVQANESFEAELYGPPVDRFGSFPTIRVLVGSRDECVTYGDLQMQLRDAKAERDALAGACTELVAGVYKVQDWSGTRVGNALDIIEPMLHGVRRTIERIKDGDGSPYPVLTTDGEQFTIDELESSNPNET